MEEERERYNDHVMIFDESSTLERSASPLKRREQEPIQDISKLKLDDDETLRD